MNFNYNPAELELIKGEFLSSSDEFTYSEKLLSTIKKHDPDVDIHFEGIYSYINYKYIPKLMHGWKIHISSVFEEAIEILDKVSKYCLENKIGFKFVKSLDTLNLLNSKSWSRSSSGKFITIYPSNEDQFKIVIEQLYFILESHKGPYILSDKRYKDCKVLYYRYGRIKEPGTLKADGSREFFLIGPNGEIEKDEPTPYFKCPTWVNDPFENLNDDNNSENEGLKDNRYIVKDAIDMTNAGGVYLAYDNILKEEVILKETRPFIKMGKNESMIIRKKEAAILKKLDEKDYTPRFIDAFYEWEHYFIVISKVNGKLLSEYRADLDTSIFTVNELSIIYENHRKIFIEIIKCLKDMHDNGISYGDFSSTNIMIREDNTVTFIDFELSNSEDDLEHFFGGTEGYKRNQGNTFKDRFTLDKEGLGFLFLNFYTDASEYLVLSEEIFINVFESIKKDFNIPIDFIDVIETLIFMPEQANLIELIKKLEQLKIQSPISKEVHYKYSIEMLPIEIERTIKQTKNAIISNSDVRKHRLFPIFPNYPNENSFGLYFGELGILLSLQHVFTNDFCKDYIISYLNSYENRTKVVPLGLFSGLSGEAYGLYKLGFEEKAIQLFNDVIKNKYMLNGCMDLKDGITGYGLVNLFFYEKTSVEKYIHEAEKVSLSLIKAMEVDDNQYYWKSKDEEIIEFGLGQGIAGIAFFFINFYKLTKEKIYLNIAKGTIRYILRHALEKNGSLYFYKNSNKDFLSPYLEGSTGIAYVLVQYIQLDRDTEMINSLEKILNTFNFKYGKGPSVDLGITAIGFVLIELYKMTNKPKYLDMLREVTEGILNFRIHRQDEIYFPSAIKSHIGFDFGTGISGILVFLKQFLNLLNRHKKVNDNQNRREENIYV